MLRYGPGTDADEKSHCAQQAFLQATDKLHDYVDAWLQLGILSLTEGAYDRAQNFLKQAIFHDCSSAEAWCNLGNLYCFFFFLKMMNKSLLVKLWTGIKLQFGLFCFI